MEYQHYTYGGASVALSQFAGERHIAHAIIRPLSIANTLAEQLEAVSNAVLAICSDSSINKAGKLHPVFRRWFLSDIANQITFMKQANTDAAYRRLPNCATSFIQQPPLDGSRVTLLAILTDAPKFSEFSEGAWTNSEGEVWMGDTSHDFDTKDYLYHFDNLLHQLGGSLADNCLRTWFMVRDIDLNYTSVVKGRNEVFSEKGLTPQTHFIASTGINGVSADPFKRVVFNAYADISRNPAQITYLYGSTHLNRTSEYGVAFERGTKVDYPDRSEIYISGTASIDNKGNILYPGNVARQTERVFENVNVLLKEAGACIDNVAHFIVYLRDMADWHIVHHFFREHCPIVPTLIVLAPVCRPGWLVEAECMAIIHNKTL